MFELDQTDAMTTADAAAPSMGASQGTQADPVGSAPGTNAAKNGARTATNDANSSLYWPPCRAFALYLDKLKFELGTLPTLSASSRSFLDLYSDVLRRGLGGTFKARGDGTASSSSVRSFLERQNPARTVCFPRYGCSSMGTICREGDVEVVVDGQLEERAEEVSRCLDLDARQSLYLVWMYCEQEIKTSANANQAKDVGGLGGPDAGAGALTSGALTSYSLAGVCQLYCDERLSLLRALETILWIGEDPVAASEVRDYVESRLIDGVLFAADGTGGRMDVEGVVLRDLKADLSGFKATNAYKAVVVAKGNKEDVNWAKVVVLGKEKEQTKMLTLLALVYYRPRKACGVSQFEELLGLASKAVREGTSSRMYVLLLLEILVLEINGPLRDLAERARSGPGPGSGSGSMPTSYPFLAGVAGRVTDTMRTLLVDAVRAGAAEGRYVSVLVLTWASILLVLPAGEAPSVAPAELAQLCEQAGGGALQHLSLMCDDEADPSGSLSLSPTENAKQMTQLSSLIVYHSLAIFLAAFDAGRSAATGMNGQVVQILSSLFAQESVNDMFLYNHDDALNQPVLRFLDALDAIGVEQLKLLTAISCTHAGSVFALSYLRKIVQSPHAAMMSPLRDFMETNDGPSLAAASVVLDFYDAACSSNAVTVIELLDVGAPTTGDDFISVLGVCIRKAPPSSQSTILASTLRLLSYFVPYTPSRAMSELMSCMGVSPLTFKLDFFDQMMSTSSTTSSYKAVLALFQFVSVLLQTAYGPTRAAITLSMNIIRIAVPYISCMASSEEKWNLAAGCLTIVRHALMRADGPGGVASEDAPRLASNDEAMTTTTAITNTTTTPVVSKKEVLELISPILPPECTTIANDVEHQGETEAIERCVVKWLRLVPVLLSEGPAVYEYLFQSVGGRNPPAATLLSYLSYPYFGSEDKAAVVRSMAHLLGYDSNVPVTAFLPKNGPRLSLLEPCAVISNAINIESPTHVESLFSAACDVLCNAVSYHPTLAVLLLPDVDSDVGNPSCSCTQHILSYAERASELYVSSPSRLSKVLDVICAAITSKKSRNGIMTSLIPNEKIWVAFMDILMRSAGGNRGGKPDGGDAGDAGDGADGGDSDDSGGGREDEVIDFHRFNVEMKVMDVFVAAICSADGKTGGKTDAGADLWRHVDLPIKKHFTLVSTVLLRKYCGLIGRMKIGEEMLRVRRLAWLAGLQVTAFALDNNGMYEGLPYEQNSLIAKLWTCILRCSKVPVPAQNPSRENLMKLCQDLYDNFLRMEEDGGDMATRLYEEPYLSMADVLLQLRDGPLPLPNQIGSAWGKLIEDFGLLRTQTMRLSELTRLQCCLFECITSLGSFVAVCTDRHGWITGMSTDSVADLNDIIDVVQSATQGYRLVSREILINEDQARSIDAALVSSAKSAVLLSDRRVTHVVEERKLFGLIGLLVDNQGIDFVVDSLADWLAVGMNVVSSSAGGTGAGIGADMMETPEREELHGVLPKLLLLTGSSSAAVAYMATSLVMVLMESRVRPAVWEQQMEDFNIVEILNGLVCAIGGNSNDSGYDKDVVLRIKSLLLLASRMISESDDIADRLISRGLCDTIVSLCHSFTDSLRGTYTETGKRSDVHQVWVCALSLCSLLSSAPAGAGHRKVESLLLRVSVSMADRIVAALVVPDVFTLGYLEEGRATLAFACSLARLGGEWLLNQPKMTAQIRRLTAAFLQFVSRDVQNASFAAISAEETGKNAKGVDLRTPVLFGAEPVLNLTAQGAPAPQAAHAGGANAAADASEVTELSITMSGHLYAMVKYALDFQRMSAPEISEAEALRLHEKDTWVQAQTLTDLSTIVASILESLLEERDEISIWCSLGRRLAEISLGSSALWALISPQQHVSISACMNLAGKIRDLIDIKYH